MQKVDNRFETDDSMQVGAAATVHIYAGDVPRFKGRTLYVNPGGPDFTTLVAEGKIPGDVWVAAITTPSVISKSAPGVYIVEADYIAMRVVGAGGTAPVAEVLADPDAIPPVEHVPAVAGSTLDAGIIQ